MLCRRHTAIWRVYLAVERVFTYFVRKMLHMRRVGFCSVLVSHRRLICLCSENLLTLTAIIATYMIVGQRTI